MMWERMEQAFRPCDIRERLFKRCAAASISRRQWLWQSGERHTAFDSAAAECFQSACCCTGVRALFYLMNK